MNKVKLHCPQCYHVLDKNLFCLRCLIQISIKNMRVVELYNSTEDRK